MNHDYHLEHQYIVRIGLDNLAAIEKKKELDLHSLVWLGAYVRNLVRTEEEGAVSHGWKVLNGAETYAARVNTQRGEISELIGVCKEELDLTKKVYMIDSQMAEFEQKTAAQNTDGSLQRDLQEVQFSRRVLGAYAGMIENFNPNYIFVASQVLKVEPKLYGNKTADELARSVNAKVLFARYTRDLLDDKPHDGTVPRLAPEDINRELFFKANELALLAVQQIIQDVLPVCKQMWETRRPVSPIPAPYSGELARA